MIKLMAGAGDPTAEQPDLHGTAEPPLARVPLRERLRILVALVLVVLIVLFAVLNTRSVKVDWIFGSGHAPLIVVIVISLVVGVVIAYIAERLSSRHRQR